MCTNMIAGVLILPAYIAWARPNFIRQYENTEEKVPYSRSGGVS